MCVKVLSFYVILGFVVYFFRCSCSCAAFGRNKFMMMMIYGFTECPWRVSGSTLFVSHSTARRIPSSACCHYHVVRFQSTHHCKCKVICARPIISTLLDWLCVTLWIDFWSRMPCSTLFKVIQGQFRKHVERLIRSVCEDSVRTHGFS